MADTAAPMDDTARRQASRGGSWWRFPSDWIVSRPGNESFFSKAVWCVLPLQYYVLSQFPGGLNEAYVAAAMTALLSIVGLLAASCLFALFYYRRETGFRGQYAVVVRKWAIALLVTWAATYALLAISYLEGGTYGDVLHGMLCRHCKLNCNGAHPDFGKLTIVEYLIYTAISVATFVFASVVYRKITRTRPQELAVREPYTWLVILTVASLMVLINGATTLPHSSEGICIPMDGDCPPAK